MDLSTESITAQAQANVQNQASISILRKTIDIQAQQGADLVQMMNATSGVGTNLNTIA